MTDFEKAIVETINNLKSRVIEYEDLKDNAMQNKEYFKGKHEAYQWAYQEILKNVRWVHPELLKYL